VGRGKDPRLIFVVLRPGHRAADSLGRHPKTKKKKQKGNRKFLTRPPAKVRQPGKFPKNGWSEFGSSASAEKGTSETATRKGRRQEIVEKAATTRNWEGGCARN